MLKGMKKHGKVPLCLERRLKPSTAEPGAHPHHCASCQRERALSPSIHWRIQGVLRVSESTRVTERGVLFLACVSISLIPSHSDSKVEANLNCAMLRMIRFRPSNWSCVSCRVSQGG